MERIYEKNHIEIFQVTPSSYYRKADMAIRHQCNGAFLVSGGVVAAVDVPTMEAANEMMAESVQLFGSPIRYVFLTHGHGDHVEGLPVFLDQDVTIFCSHRLLKQVSPAGSASRAVFVGVNGTLTLRMGDLDVELFTFQGALHSPQDMFVRLPGEQILCTGDTTVSFSMLFFHMADAENWIASLRKIEKAGGKYLFPGHGDVFPISHAGALADYIGVVQDAAGECISRLGRDEIRDMDGERLNAIVSGYLSGQDPNAAILRLKGEDGAERELRMMIRSMLFTLLR